MEDPTFLAGDIPMEQLNELLTMFLPVYIISGILIVVTLIPLSYRMRLSSYRIMENTPEGAIKAIVHSMKLMKGNCIALFKLDLSFWWFYLLQGVLFLFINGVPYFFPISGGQYVLLRAAYSLLMLLLEYRLLAYVQTTYAVFYQTILENASAPTSPQIEE